MSTRIVRLKTGEELITGYRVEDGVAYLKNPAILIPTGQGQIGFMPWMMYAEFEDSTVKLPSSEVLLDAKPVNELLNQYNQTIGSGLIVPENKPEIPNLKFSAD